MMSLLIILGKLIRSQIERRFSNTKGAITNYKTEPRGYWKVTKGDLEDALNFDGIDFVIDGSGKLWTDGSGVVTVRKGSDEWTHLYDHIQKLDSFIKDGENTNSKSVPSKLRNCFKKM